MTQTQNAVIEALLAAMPSPALVLGPDERVRVQNAAAGLAMRTDGVGQHHIAVLRQPALLGAIAQTYADGTPRTAAFSSLDGATDTEWSVTVTAPVFEGARNILLVFADVTAIGQVARMRRDFVANLSHELRTPLTAVAGFVETLRGAARDDPEARDRFLAIVGSETDRMTRLVDDLLSLSRVEETERRRPVARVDLSRIVAEVLTVMEPVARAQDVTLSAMGLDVPAKMRGDAEQLRQVLFNLVENAIKYGGPGREVVVTLGACATDTALRGNAMQVTVTDQGGGIAAHHIPRLTERFYRVDGHRSRSLGGTGLGLAIVKHVVGRHRGRLRIESTQGEGSRFTVILPVD